MGARKKPDLNRWITLLLLAAGVALLAGCIIIPTNYYQSASRENINLQTTNSLAPGVTTRQEMLMKLGEPDYVTEDGQRLGFAWTKVKAIWALIGQSSSLAGEVWHNYFLETSFDSSNRLSDMHYTNRWSCEVTSQ